MLSFPAARPDGTGPRRLVLVGTGDGSPTALRRAGAGLARSLAGVDDADVALAADRGADEVGALVEGLLLGAYQPPRTGTSTRPGPVGDAATGRRAGRATPLCC